jgi:hypothetical protein
LVPIGKPRSWCVGHDLLSALAMAARTATSHSSEIAAQRAMFLSTVSISGAAAIRRAVASFSMPVAMTVELSGSVH